LNVHFQRFAVEFSKLFDASVFACDGMARRFYRKCEGVAYCNAAFLRYIRFIAAEKLSETLQPEPHDDRQDRKARPRRR
jgi:hypothetical protein